MQNAYSFAGQPKSTNSTEPPKFPPCEQVVCPEIEMTDYDYTQENQAIPSDDVDMIDVHTLSQQVPGLVAGNPFLKRDNNTKPKSKQTNVMLHSAQTQTDPPSSFEVGVFELLRERKIYSVTYEKGKLEVNIE
ncbi:hypothetical protein F5Y00DRAFT_271273 [Daldinia vernicosa]|uniref:uncharacterized protein n=1 Tax=Daldinia vernicosa TaxID=114800 RepID=UPI0020082244|nr:uncharacterized protein F5Y00DRAFT_271273 [Daldinia vernicosa]KAI0847328.1 hypothetical protein F5Y00DRAFT_271273 [Daldinia vernicosa]